MQFLTIITDLNCTAKTRLKKGNRRLISTYSFRMLLAFQLNDILISNCPQNSTLRAKEKKLYQLIYCFMIL